MPTRRRRSTALRVLLVLLAAIVALPLLAGIAALVFVDADAWRPQIVAAVQRTTGREITIGHLRLVPSLTPSLAVTDLALANLPGGSRPEMLTVARAEVKLALLPLLAGRVEISRLVLLKPDILLERTRDGLPNWRFAPSAPPTAAPAAAPAPPRPAPAAPASESGGPELLVRDLRIEGGRVTWRAADGKATSFDLRLLEASAQGMESPIELNGQGVFAGQTVAVTAQAGPLSRLADSGAATPWPIKASLESPGARLTLAGTLTHPLAGSGYAVAVEGAAVNLSALDGLLGTKLPPLRQVAFAVRLTDTGGPVPDVTSVALRAGASDLDALRPGLKLTRADFSTRRLDQPLRGEAVGSIGGAPLRLTASIGPLASLLPGAAAPPGGIPVEIAAEAAGASLGVKGSLPPRPTLSGVDLAVTGRIPDLAALAPLAGRPLPALRPVTLDGRLVGREGPPGLTLRGLALTAPEADLSGELSLTLAAKPSLQANLSSRRIDLDALHAAMPAAAAPAPPAAAAPPPAPPAGPPRLIPDTPLPLGALGAADADLRFSIGELRSGGVAYRDLTGHLALQDGRLALDPFAAAVPGGKALGKLGVDSRASPPAASLTLRTPGLSLKPLLAALKLPDDITGTAAVDADLRGTGDTPRALAASLTGHLGIAMADGELDNRLLGGVLGAVLQGAPQGGDLPGLAGGGRTRIRCLALRADAEAGMVTVDSLALDAGRAALQGGGTVNLRDEGLQLRLRPMLRTGTPIVLPVRVGGTLATPKIGPDTRGAPLAGALLGALAGAERNGDICGPALAAARGTARPPPAPAPAAPARPAAPHLPDLRRLLPR